MLIVAAFVIATLSMCSIYLAIELKIVRARVGIAENQSSKLKDNLDIVQTRYDNLVASLQVKAHQRPEPKPQKRRARTFSEFRDAQERGTLPMGVKEQHVNPNV